MVAETQRMAVVAPNSFPISFFFFFLRTVPWFELSSHKKGHFSISFFLVWVYILSICVLNMKNICVGECYVQPLVLMLLDS